MPKCKNDFSRHYKGTEPSPKGLGLCAHAEKIGKKRKGKDKNMWIVKKIGKSQRWVKVLPKAKLRKKLPGKTLTLRLVFGYYDNDQIYHDDIKAISNPTDAQIYKIFKSAKPYKRINNYTNYNTDLVITSNNVKRVKVCDPPQLERTFWEKLGNKFTGWLHSPDKLVIVDVVARLKPANDANRTQEIDDDFLENYRGAVNHDFKSGESMLYGSAHASAYILEIDEIKSSKHTVPNPRKWKYW